MKEILYILILCIGIGKSYGQEFKLINNLSSLEKRASIHEEKGEYDQAAQLLVRAYEKRPEALIALRAARNYSKSKRYERAESWYRKVLSYDSCFQEDHWNDFLELLLITHQYEDLKKYQGKLVSKTDLSSKIESLDQLPLLVTDSSSVFLSSLHLNSLQTEFSPYYLGEGLVFLSDREEASNTDGMEWNKENYVSAYYTEQLENGRMKTPEKYGVELSVNGAHLGPMVFHGQNQVMYTLAFEGTKSQPSIMGLYHARFNENKQKWDEISAFPFNSDTYSLGHPALDSEGRHLVFVSNQTGGEGGTDLYHSYWEEGKWSQPQNLGNSINTTGNEMFPFFLTDDQLIFSSDGHVGLGELDIFQVDLSGSTKTVRNLGSPYNSPYSDFGYISDNGGQSGYLCSNREKKGLDDDLYRFVVKWTKASIKILDVMGQTIVKTRVELWNDNRMKDVQYTDSTGRVEFIVTPGESVHFSISKKDFTATQTQDTIWKAGQSYFREFVLRRIPTTVSKPKKAVDKLERLYHHKTIMVQVDGRVYEYKEVGRRRYLTNADEQILLTNEFVNPDQPIEERARQSIEKKGMKIDLNVVLRNIYFDKNSFELSSEAKKELDKVVQIMTLDHKVAFEVSSFADSRGGLSFNDELSFKRSQSVARYLMLNDIPASRLVLESYGEQGLLNECDDDHDCDELYHAVNRRVELNIFMRKLYK